MFELLIFWAVVKLIALIAAGLAVYVLIEWRTSVIHKREVARSVGFPSEYSRKD